MKVTASAISDIDNPFFANILKNPSSFSYMQVEEINLGVITAFYNLCQCVFFSDTKNKTEREVRNLYYYADPLFYPRKVSDKDGSFYFSFYEHTYDKTSTKDYRLLVEPIAPNKCRVIVLLEQPSFNGSLLKDKSDLLKMAEQFGESDVSRAMKTMLSVLKDEDYVSPGKAAQQRNSQIIASLGLIFAVLVVVGLLFSCVTGGFGSSTGSSRNTSRWDSLSEHEKEVYEQSDEYADALRELRQRN